MCTRYYYYYFYRNIYSLQKNWKSLHSLKFFTNIRAFIHFIFYFLWSKSEKGAFHIFYTYRHWCSIPVSVSPHVAASFLFFFFSQL